MLDFDVMRLTRHRSRTFSFRSSCSSALRGSRYFVCRSATVTGFFQEMIISLPIYFEITYSRRWLKASAGGSAFFSHDMNLVCSPRLSAHHCPRAERRGQSYEASGLRRRHRRRQALDQRPLSTCTRTGWRCGSGRGAGEPGLRASAGGRQEGGMIRGVETRLDVSTLSAHRRPETDCHARRGDGIAAQTAPR
jgi:hypothetical protein